MSFKVNKRLGKQIVVHSYNGITLSSKKEWTTKTQSNIGQSSKYYFWVKEAKQKLFFKYIFLSDCLMAYHTPLNLLECTSGEL